jgi:glycosyltransferase involved in cell wall biosynthesis
MGSTSLPLSIGLPVHNGEKYLEQVLKCILDQTFIDYELIISDNGSTDMTEAICRDFESKDNRIQYFRSSENRGASWNFNRVVHKAKGEYFKWLADDDLYTPNFLSECIDALKANSNIVLAYSWSKVIDKDGNIVRDHKVNMQVDSPFPWVRFYHQIKVGLCTHIFGVIKRDIFMKTPLLGNYSSSDKVLLGALSLHGKFYEIPEFLMFRRDHPERSMRVYRDAKKRNYWFDPNKLHSRSYPYWRLMKEHVNVVSNSPLSFNAKIKCYYQIARWLKIKRKLLLKDLVNVQK